MLPRLCTDARYRYILPLHCKTYHQWIDVIALFSSAEFPAQFMERLTPRLYLVAMACEGHICTHLVEFAHPTATPAGHTHTMQNVGLVCVSQRAR